MNKKLVTSVILGLTVALGSVAPALADSRKVVTLGADLTQEQQRTMLRYFGVTEDAVDIIWINNDDEREHLGSYVPLEQIGTRTFSCALVSPTRTGGIQVKTANLNWVTCNMIASTLSTSGVKNCQVVAASPFEVSGTGALTGVIMAYETAQESSLEPVKVELANEELVTTATLSDEIGASKATAVINATKIEVIENNVTDITEITNIVNNISNEYDVYIDDSQSEAIAELMAKIAQQEYDYVQLKATLERVQANVAGDAGASEEVQKELEASAEIAEAAAYEAAYEEAVENGTVTADDDEEETEVSILDFTDVSALQEGGVPVMEGDTQSSVLEQEEDNEYETEENGVIMVGGGTDIEGIPAPEGDETEEALPSEQEKKYTKEDLDFADAEIYDKIEKGMKDVVVNEEVSNEYGDVVYLTTDAAKELPKAIEEYVLKVLAEGADKVAEEEKKDPEIPADIMKETAAMEEDKNYEDEDLKQIDKFVRRLVLKDSEKIFTDCYLEDYDAEVIYEEIMAVLEEAFGVEPENLLLTESNIEEPEAEFDEDAGIADAEEMDGSDEEYYFDEETEFFDFDDSDEE